MPCVKKTLIFVKKTQRRVKMTFLLRKPIHFVPFHNRHRMYRFWDLSEKVKILLSFFTANFDRNWQNLRISQKHCFWSNEPSSMNWCCWIILVKDQLPKHNNIWSVWVIFLEIQLRIHPFIAFFCLFWPFFLVYRNLYGKLQNVQNQLF